MRGFLIVLCLILSPAYVAALPEPSDPPPLRGEKGYVINIETAVFNGPVADVKRTMQTPAGGVLAFVEPTSRIPEIASLTPILGSFPDQGAVRQVTLSDGNTVVERVLANTDTEFSYQIWDFTSANARALSHIRGSFEYQEIAPNQTQVTWTYAVAPRVFLVRPFVRGFLNNDFAPFMESGLQGAARAYNAAAER